MSRVLQAVDAQRKCAASVQIECIFIIKLMFRKQAPAHIGPASHRPDLARHRVRSLVGCPLLFLPRKETSFLVKEASFLVEEASFLVEEASFLVGEDSSLVLEGSPSPPSSLPNLAPLFPSPGFAWGDPARPHPPPTHTHTAL